MTSFTTELIAKAKAAKSPEELLELAKANGVELTEEEAKTCFEQLHTNAAISDDELEAVAGGGICEFFEDFFRTRNRFNESSNPYCGDRPNITNLPYKPDAQTSDSGIMRLPYDSDDNNKIVFL